MKANKHLATVMAATMVAGSVVPVMAETTNETLIGKNRIETAVKISKDGWNSAETVILVNDGAIADALTATPLAFAKNAPILLTSKNGLSDQVKAEIKRLGAKNAILIGGNTVLPASIEKELKELGLKPDRIKGDTREETALAIAKRLDAISDVSEIAVVNGTKGLADAVSVAAAAAERHMPILLANPKKGLSASEKFIKDEAIKASYLIGGTTVLPNKMVSSLPGKKRLEGSNRNDTNAKVIETFYKGKELKNVYVAKDGRGGDSQLIDALAVGVLAAKNASPVLIASKNLNAKQVNVINTKEVSNIVQVGGKGNEGAFNQLKEIEKEDVYEVETVEELKEALAKANANDKIVLKPNATITEDIIINTDKNVDIKVEGTVTGKVEITAPNGNVANNSTSKPSTGGGTIVTPPADNSIKVDTPEELKEALKNAKAGDVIKITGNIGSTSSYEEYKITKEKVTITADKSVTVHGSFIVTGEECAIKNITIMNKGDKKGENTAVRNAINAACSKLTVTGCNFKINNPEGGISNAISIWPTKSDVKYDIKGNKFEGFKNNDSGYTSAAIIISGGVAKPQITGIETPSVMANMTSAEDEAIINGNTFVDCKGDYCREDWTTGNKVYSKSISNGDNLYLEGAADSAKYYVTNDIERKSNATVKSGTTLAISSGKTMTLSDGVELTVNGEITGKLTGKGATSKLIIGENGKYGNLEKGTYLWTNNEWVNEKTAIVSTEEELRNALENKEKTTIKLNDNIKIEKRIHVKRSITIDLNNHELNCTELLNTEGNHSNGNPITDENPKWGYAILVTKEREAGENSPVSLKVINGNLKFGARQEKQLNAGIGILGSNVDLTVSNVNIDMVGFDYKKAPDVAFGGMYAIATNGTHKNIKIDVNGSKMINSIMGMYLPSDKTDVTLSNTEIISGTGISIKGGTLNIIDSKITATDDYGAPGAIDDYINSLTENNSGSEAAGEAIYLEGNYQWDAIVNISGNSILESKHGYALRTHFLLEKATSGEHSGKTLKKEININGATVKAGEDKVIFKNHKKYDSFPNDATNSLNSIKITAGKYTDDVTKYLEPGYKCTESNGIYTVVKDDTVSTIE